MRERDDEGPVRARRLLLRELIRRTSGWEERVEERERQRRRMKTRRRKVRLLKLWIQRRRWQ